MKLRRYGRPAALVEHVVVITVLMLAAGVACTARNPESGVPAAGAAQSPEAPAPKAYTGVLKGGMVGIGGEHTGWVLVPDAKGPEYEVDVGKLLARARDLEGRRVKVVGTLHETSYVERGRTMILVADSIEPASP